MTRYRCTKDGHVPFTAEEEAAWDAAYTEENNTARAAELAREERNNLLKKSDWTQVPDYSGSDKSDWATYRQALRDVPAQSGFPTTINWPAEP